VLSKPSYPPMKKSTSNMRDLCLGRGIRVSTFSLLASRNAEFPLFHRMVAFLYITFIAPMPEASLNTACPIRHISYFGFSYPSSGIFAGLSLGYMSLDETQLHVLSGQRYLVRLSEFSAAQHSKPLHIAWPVAKLCWNPHLGRIMR